MKKVFLSVFALSLLACSKKDNALAISPNSSSDMEFSLAKGNSEMGSMATTVDPKINATWYHTTTQPGGGYCQGPYKINCCVLSEIIITPTGKSKPHYARIDVNNDVITEINKPELKDIIENLPKSYRDKLKSGKYYLSLSTEDATTLCYIAGSNYPVNSDNMEFAFQYSK